MHVKITLLGVLAATALAYPVAAPASPEAAWRQALAVRSDALNREYHLGQYAVPRALTARTTSSWYRALELRSKAMNERYSLGRIAQPSSGRTFDWTAAGVGAAVASGICLLLAAAWLTARTRPDTRAQRLS